MATFHNRYSSYICNCKGVFTRSNLSFKLNLCTCVKNFLTWIDFICTLSGNIKFICTTFRNRKKCKLLAIFSSCFETSTNQFYIFRQYMYMNIMFILQYHICKNKNKKELNLHTKGKKKNIGHFGRALLVIYTMVCFRPVFYTLQNKIVEYRRLYTSRRCIKHRFIRISLT